MQDMKKTINGNTAGIRDILLREMEGLYELSMQPDIFLSRELCDAMARFTARINREILVYISRSGSIEDVRIGDDKSVGMQQLRLVRNADRLSGVRCVQTHPGGSGMLSDVDMGSLASLRLDAMAAIGVSGEGAPTTV